MKRFGLLLFLGCALAQNGYNYPHNGPLFHPAGKNAVSYEQPIVPSALEGLPVPSLPNFSIQTETKPVETLVSPQTSFIPPVPLEVQQLRKTYIPPAPLPNNVPIVPENTYIPPAPAPQNTYVPPVTQNTYIPPAPEAHVFVTPAPTNTYIPPVPQTLKSETFSTGQVQTNTFLPQVKANLSPPPTSFTSSQNSYSSQPSGQESFNFQLNSFDQQLTFNVQQPQQAFNVQQQETPLQNTFQQQTSFNQPGPQQSISFNQQEPQQLISFNQQGPQQLISFNQQEPQQQSISFNQQGPQQQSTSLNQQGPQQQPSFNQQAPQQQQQSTSFNQQAPQQQQSTSFNQQAPQQQSQQNTVQQTNSQGDDRAPHHPNPVRNNQDSTPIHEENTDVNHQHPYTGALAKFIPHFMFPERKSNIPLAPTYEEQQIHKENLMNLKFISANLNYNLFNYTTTTPRPITTSEPLTAPSNEVSSFNYQPMNVQGQSAGSSGPMTINLDYAAATIPNVRPAGSPNGPLHKYLPKGNSFQQKYHVFAPVKSKELFFSRK